MQHMALQIQCVICVTWLHCIGGFDGNKCQCYMMQKYVHALERKLGFLISSGALRAKAKKKKWSKKWHMFAAASPLCLATCVALWISSPLEARSLDSWSTQKEVRADYRDTATRLYLTMSPDGSSSHRMPDRKWPRFSGLNVFTYMLMTMSVRKHCWELTVTEALVYLPSWWNSAEPQIPAVLWLQSWWC